MNLSVVAALVRKDLRLFLTDRRALLVSVAAPILMASFFGFVFSGGNGERSTIPVRLVDEDGSAVSQKIAAGLGGETSLQVMPASLAEARDAVRAGKVVVAVVLPKGFGESAQRAFFRGTNKPKVELLHDPSHSAELAMVRGVLTQHVMQAVSAQTFGADGQQVIRQQLAELEAGSGLPESQRSALRDMLGSVDRYLATQPRNESGSPAAGGGLSMPYDTHEEAVTSGQGTEYNSYAHAFAGMGVQFVFLSALESAVGILLERQRGLFRRLRSAPLSRGTLLLSRGISGTLIALFVLACLFGFGAAVFRIRIEGSFPGFLLVCLASSACCATFGLLLAAVGRTPPATRGIGVFVVLILTMLGGAWVPTFLFPKWMQTATLIAPTRWAVDGLDGTTWRGLGLSAALPPVAVLLAFAAVFGVLAVMRFRWEQE